LFRIDASLRDSP